jgi:hypothetical protein
MSLNVVDSTFDTRFSFMQIVQKYFAEDLKLQYFFQVQTSFFA